MKLRIAHYPQIPCKPFYVEVNSVQEGYKLSQVLADYDLFQYENKIKPDYSNMTVLEQFDEDTKEWVDWIDEETGIADMEEYLIEKSLGEGIFSYD